MILQTPRLVLRLWQQKDEEPWVMLNQDPRVMRYYPEMPDRKTCLHQLASFQQHQRDWGYSLYACELRQTGDWIGYIGLYNVPFEASFTPATEIGWRLAAPYWNQGLATEGAKEVLRHAFEDLSLPEVVSLTAHLNAPSRRVMEKIGLHRVGDFDHPRLPDDSPLRPHVLYRLRLGGTTRYDNGVFTQ